MTEVEEVVVTGMFTRKASSFTGSATTIKGDELLKVGNQNVFQSLKSMEPGLIFSRALNLVRILTGFRICNCGELP